MHPAMRILSSVATRPRAGWFLSTMTNPQRFLFVTLGLTACSPASGPPGSDHPARDGGTQPVAIAPLPCDARLCESFEDDAVGQQPARNRWSPWGQDPPPAAVVNAP